jgi:hypothetical protein
MMRIAKLSIEAIVGGFILLTVCSPSSALPRHDCDIYEIEGFSGFIKSRSFDKTFEAAAQDWQGKAAQYHQRDGDMAKANINNAVSQKWAVDDFPPNVFSVNLGQQDSDSDFIVLISGYGCDSNEYFPPYPPNSYVWGIPTPPPPPSTSVARPASTAPQVSALIAALRTASGPTAAQASKQAGIAALQAYYAVQAKELKTAQAFLQQSLNCLVGAKGTGFAEGPNACSSLGNGALPDASSHAEQQKELEEAAQRARAGLAAVKLNDAQLAGTQILIAIRRSSISMK